MCMCVDGEGMGLGRMEKRTRDKMSMSVWVGGGEMLFLHLGLGWKNTSSLCLSLRWEDTGDSFCVGVGATQKGKELNSFSRRRAM